MTQTPPSVPSRGKTTLVFPTSGILEQQRTIRVDRRIAEGVFDVAAAEVEAIDAIQSAHKSRGSPFLAYHDDRSIVLTNLLPMVEQA